MKKLLILILALAISTQATPTYTATNVLTLTTPKTWASGDSIYLYKKSDGAIVFYGEPDAGAHPYNTGLSQAIITIRRK
jgi:hypothetical protein